MIGHGHCWRHTIVQRKNCRDSGIRKVSGRLLAGRCPFGADTAGFAAAVGIADIAEVVGNIGIAERRPSGSIAGAVAESASTERIESAAFPALCSAVASAAYTVRTGDTAPAARDSADPSRSPHSH